MQFLPENPVQRSVEARALLVALAAAIDLRSASASDFAVNMLCRAIRTCLMNALGSLRQTMSTEDRAALERAEADLQVRRSHAPPPRSPPTIWLQCILCFHSSVVLAAHTPLCHSLHPAVSAVLCAVHRPLCLQ